MSEQHYSGPYDEEKCHFCGKSSKKGIEFTAAYARAEDANPSGPFFPACEGCARQPYPQPEEVVA